MAKEYIILLKEFKFGRCGLVNQYLIDTGLSKDFHVVKAEYYEERQTNWVGAHPIKGTRHGAPQPEHIGYTTHICLGLETTNKKAAFLLEMKGTGALLKKLRDYETQHG